MPLEPAPWLAGGMCHSIRKYEKSASGSPSVDSSQSSTAITFGSRASKIMLSTR